jgi:hypothetical protein
MIVAILLVLALTAVAEQSADFFAQKTRQLLYADFSLGTPEEYEELISLAKSGNFAEAASLLDSILASKPRLPQYQRLARAYCHAAAGNHATAIGLFLEESIAAPEMQLGLATAFCHNNLGEHTAAAGAFIEVALNSPLYQEKQIASWNGLLAYYNALDGETNAATAERLLTKYQAAYEQVAYLFGYADPHFPRERQTANLAERLTDFGQYSTSAALWEELQAAPLPTDGTEGEITLAYAAARRADNALLSGNLITGALWYRLALELSSPDSETAIYAENRRLLTLQHLTEQAEAKLRGGVVTIGGEKPRDDSGDGFTQLLTALYAIIVEENSAGGLEKLESALLAGGVEEEVATLAWRLNRVYEELGMTELAEQAMEIARLADPDSPLVRYNSRLREAHRALDAGDYATAATLAWELTAVDSTAVRLEAGMILVIAGNATSRADWLDQAVAIGRGLESAEGAVLLLSASDAFLLRASDAISMDRLLELRNTALVVLADAYQLSDSRGQVEVRLRTGEVYAAYAKAALASEMTEADKSRENARRAWLLARTEAERLKMPGVVKELDRLLEELAGVSP